MALTKRSGKSKVLASSGPTITVSVKTVDTEQTGSDKHKALRLFCGAMIRLYLQDQANKPANGKSVGIL
jgi:hypothetical protein